jgi:hypothetical protein
MGKIKTSIFSNFSNFYCHQKELGKGQDNSQRVP